MLGFIIFIIMVIYIRNYYKWTEKLGYFKSMGITALVVFSVVGLAMIAGNTNWKKYKIIVQLIINFIRRVLWLD